MIVPKVAPVLVNNNGIPFFVFQIENHKAFSEVFVQHSYNLQKESQQNISYQGEGTWHSSDNLHLNAKFTQLKILFNEAITLLWQMQKCSKTDFEWDYKALWVNISKFGDHTFPHAHWGHAGSLFGGVYYPQVPKNSGNLRLFSPDKKLTSVGGFNLKQLTPFHLPTYIDLEVKSGQVVLFPNWIGHGVLSNKSFKDRISYTFLAGIKQFPIDDWPQTPELPNREWDASNSGFE